MLKNFPLHAAFCLAAIFPSSRALAADNPPAMSADEAASEAKSKVVAGLEAKDLRLSDAGMQWWRDAKFGLFIHWGLYAIPAKGEWWQHNAKVPNEEYAKLAGKFAPKHFDAAQWARVAKNAGMKYTVLTARHHDGFALWDSPSSHGGFDAMRSAAKHDFIADYTKAVREAGLRVGLYYSPMDWRFPGYFKPKELRENAELMKRQAYGQVRELVSNYGRIDVLWYDGGWLAMQGNDADAAWFWEPLKLNRIVREKQPDVVMNPRSGWEGDFICNEGPGRVTGPIVPRAWEKCLNLNRSTWGYSPHRNLMSRDDVIDMLVNTVVRGGNMLLNVGPDADGVIPPGDVARLAEVGDWLRRNGEAIYDTKAGPFPPVEKTCGTTSKGSRIYVHLLATRDDAKAIGLPALARKVTKATLLNGGAPVVFSQSDAGINLALPVKIDGEPDIIVVLELDGPV